MMSESRTSIKKESKMIMASLLVVLAAIANREISANEYEVYPGEYYAQVVSVDAADRVTIHTTIWPGYVRTLQITLSGIAVPEVTAEAKECQLELARRAVEFTQAFLSEAKQLKVRSIIMENSAYDEARAKLYSEKGSLAEALKKEGLARPDSIDAQQPWC